MIDNEEEQETERYYRNTKRLSIIVAVLMLLGIIFMAWFANHYRQ